VSTKIIPFLEHKFVLPLSSLYNYCMKKICFAILLLSLPISYLSAEDLIVAFHSYEGTELYNRVRLWFDSLEEETGLDFLLRYMSLERARTQLLENKIDADMGRTKLVYPQEMVLYLSPPILNSDFFIYTTDWRNDGIILNELASKTLIAPLGSVLIDKWIEDQDLKNVIYIRDQELALSFLYQGRGNYYIESAIIQESIRKDQRFSSIIRRLEEPIFTENLYLVLSRNRSSLAGTLIRGIEALESRGVTAALFPR